MGYQHVSVRISSSFCVEKGAKEHFIMSSQNLCKLSNYSYFQLFQRTDFLSFFELFGHSIDFFVVHTGLTLPKNLKKSNKYDNK